MVNYLATATLALSVLTTAPQPVEWEADYGDALAATRADDRPLLVVIDKPAVEEARVEPALLADGQLGGEQAELLAPYRLCHVDAETEYGQGVAKVFDAKQLPYVAVIDKRGRVILHSQSGRIGADDWKAMLTKYQDGTRAGAAARHVTYKLSEEDTIQKPTTRSYSGSSYCPSCRRR